MNPIRNLDEESGRNIVYMLLGAGDPDGREVESRPRCCGYAEAAALALDVNGMPPVRLEAVVA